MTEIFEFLENLMKNQTKGIQMLWKSETLVWKFQEGQEKKITKFEDIARQIPTK
jgi:hypothetical protein